MGVASTADVSPGQFALWTAHHKEIQGPCKLEYDLAHYSAPITGGTLQLMWIGTSTELSDCMPHILEIADQNHTKYDVVDASTVEFGLSSAKKSSK